MTSKRVIDFTKKLDDIEDDICLVFGYYKFEEGSFYIYMNRKEWKIHTRRIFYFGEKFDEILFVSNDGKIWRCSKSQVFIKENNSNDTIRGLYDKDYQRTKGIIKRPIESSLSSITKNDKGDS